MFEELSKQVYPIIDFPGYWAYEAGANSTDVIPADQESVTVGVADTKPFEPSSHPHSVNRLPFESFKKDIVICPRDADGELDWLAAEFGSVMSVDSESKTIQVRRWRTRQEALRERAIWASCYWASRIVGFLAIRIQNTIPGSLRMDHSHWDRVTE